MSEPKKQHIIPKAYLRQFVTDQGSHVYCIDLYDKYRTGIQELGIGDIRFTIKNFYTDNRLEDKYSIEKLLSEIETGWPDVMEEINKKGVLSIKTKAAIVEWIYCSAFRNRLNRTNYGEKYTFLHTVLAAHNKIELDEKELEKAAKEFAKETQLNAFTNSEHMERMFTLFQTELASKMWRVLEAPEGQYFWTNDKPAFSPNMHPYHRQHFPFHFNPELNFGSVVFLVLSPRFCLEVSPYHAGTPPGINLWNSEVVFATATIKELVLINTGIFETADKFLISHRKELLETVKFTNQTEG